VVEPRHRHPAAPAPYHPSHVRLLGHRSRPRPRRRLCRRRPAALCPLSQGSHPKWSFPRRSLPFPPPISSLPPESLVLDRSIDAVGSLLDDLAILQDALSDNDPAYILAKLDPPSTEWTAFCFVPDTAPVRGKVCIPCRAMLSAACLWHD
jgi:hypothetical protein